MAPEVEKKIRFGLPLLLVALITAALSYSAYFRPFWQDENFELNDDCLLATSHLLKNGATVDCNPAPLFHLAEKTIFSFWHGDWSLTLHVRILSLLSALGILLLFMRYMSRLHWFAAIFAILGVSSDFLFWNHGTEARAYIFWLFLTAILFFTTLDLASSPASKKKLWLICLAALAATSSSVGEVFFGLGLIGAFIVLERAKARRIFWALLPGMALGFYYAGRVSCSNFALDTNLSIWHTLAHGDFSLVIGVLRLLWPKSFWHALPNFFFLLSAVFLFRTKLEWKGRLILVPDARVLRVLRFTALTCLISGAATATAIASKNHYFVQRNFILLLLWRGVFTGVGAYLFLEMFRRLPRVRQGVALSGCAACFLILAHDFNEWGYFSTPWRPALAGADCSLFDRPQTVYIQGYSHKFENLNTLELWHRLETESHYCRRQIIPRGLAMEGSLSVPNPDVVAQGRNWVVPLDPKNRNRLAPARICARIVRIPTAD